ncbi:MAG: DUF2628 domain-containing protein [Alphaproteobacteria bacterium]|nr:DUF2628 domain-containing protein [Alphaproteobacteria bacterium]QQS56891.1 MAG: DUF2628 domain-containing protein [Alphaproteobacteria bacterium]
MKFRNPISQRIEVVKEAFLWCLLFGPIYFLYKRAWLHAIISLLLLFPTGGVSWLIYPFFARRIVVKQYKKKGWQEI